MAEVRQPARRFHHGATMRREEPARDALLQIHAAGLSAYPANRDARAALTWYLQTTLIEAAKVALRWHAEFALLYKREK
jgi:hypothetical protein